MLNRASKELHLERSGTGKSGGRTTDKGAESAEPEYIGVVENFRHKEFARAAAEVSDHNYRSDIRQKVWHGRGEPCTELYALCMGLAVLYLIL